ncbi:MAG: hypothetical protein QOF45_752 [Gaiellaceae bacterium]|jgi:hypothetical protein|nr:hypothetical protein [Gaiellaceae bacterium]
MRDERCDAEVILDVVFDRGLLFLVVENTGDRPAHSVRIKFDKPFGGVDGTKKMQRLALFRRLEFLAPRKSISVFLDRSASYFARDEPTQLTAAISWRTPAGERRSTTINHDLEIYRDLGFIDREVPRSGRPA